VKRTALAGATLAILVSSGCGGAPAPAGVATARTGGVPAATPGAGDAVTAYIEGQRRFAACLRAAGVDVTDPDAKGNVHFGDLGKVKRDAQGRAALQRCQQDLPPRPKELNDPPQPQSKDQIERARRYARCMQANGAPDFPDPGPDGYFDGDRTWDQDTAGAQRASRICTPIIDGPGVATASAQG
jgi:hypothetical protein